MKKKSLLVVIALVLVCAMSIMGTVAYMKHNTGAVTNTFIAVGGGKLADGLTLNESPAVKGNDGEYTLDTVAEKVQANSYEAMPGMTLPKDPTITIVKKTAAPAYLYLEVVGALPTAYSWTLNSNWAKIEGLTGNNGGAVYVWTENSSSVITGTDANKTYNIITNDQITIAADTQGSDLITNDTNKTLTFYAYLAQSTVGENSTPESVYETVFPATSGN